MKRLLIAVVAILCLQPFAMAETSRPATLIVKTSDLNLASEAGAQRLESRLVRRIWAICGHPTQAGLTYANTGGGLPERAACIAGIKASPSSHPAVRAALEKAKARAG